MLEKIVRLLEKTNNISRSTYFWNAANAMILAMQSPVVLAVATRTNGEADAGIFSIALAEANLMYFLGQYGLRRYQSSDINQDFKFSEYHMMRIITSAVMLAGLLNSDADLEHPVSKKATYQLDREIYRIFTEKAGASICRDLKGVDTGKMLYSCEDCIRLGVEAAEAVLGDRL